MRNAFKQVRAHIHSHTHFSFQTLFLYAMQSFLCYSVLVYVSLTKHMNDYKEKEEARGQEHNERIQMKYCAYVSLCVCLSVHAYERLQIKKR